MFISPQLPAPLAPPTIPLEASVQKECQLKYTSVLTDLSNLSLPRPTQEGVACAHRQRFPPGVMESGDYFVTTLFRVAQRLVSMSEGESVSAIHPLSSEVSRLT